VIILVATVKLAALSIVLGVATGKLIKHGKTQ
jgi:hypothetical protein